MFKLSLVTVTYNSASTIRDTLESIKGQTNQSFEYIIVDGASKDNTVAIVREYLAFFGERLKIISEKDKGLYDAMNKGFKLATGEVIGILNSDDVFHTNTVVENILKIFDANKEIDGLFADMIYVAQDDINKKVRLWSTGSQEKFSTGWHPSHPTLYVKNDIYKKYGYFNLDFKLAADFELMLRFIDRHNIRLYYWEEIMMRMRLGGVTNKNWKNIYLQNIECYRAFSENNLKAGVLYPVRRLLPKLKQFFK